MNEPLITLNWAPSNILMCLFVVVDWRLATTKIREECAGSVPFLFGKSVCLKMELSIFFRFSEMKRHLFGTEILAVRRCWILFDSREQLIIAFIWWAVSKLPSASDDLGELHLSCALFSVHVCTFWGRKIVKRVWIRQMRSVRGSERAARDGAVIL